jgi:hypothetical protein
MKNAGFATIAILAVIAVIVVFSGVLKPLMPVEQLSPTAQKFLNPDAEVSNFPITIYGNVKNNQIAIDMLKARIGVVDDELTKKAKEVEATYDKLIGTINQPGIFGSIALMAATAFITKKYQESKLYTPEEVKKVKEGETIL